MGRAKPAPADRTITTTDFLQLDRADAPAGGLADWLTERLRLAIEDGRLPVGERLPATRELAGDLRVSRGVVTEAYRRLAEEGQVAGFGRGGTRVVNAPLVRPEPEPGERADTAPFDASPPGNHAIDGLRSAPARIDLSPGVPDLAAFPRTAWLRAERTVLARLSPDSFAYGDPRGARPFRAAVATWLARNRGIRVHPDHVLVVAGVAQALALLARVLRADGVCTIAVEDPGSLGTRSQLGGWQVDTPPVPVDDGGLRVDVLRASGVPAVLLTPAHQFPTGAVLDGDRRRELAAWADAGGLVVEDDYDAEHRYDRPPVPALKATLPDRVCYTGSVSKLLAPALRVGWLLVPARYRDAAVAAKRDSDLGNAVLPQLVLAELMASGELERHLRLVRRRHLKRRDATVDAVRALLPRARVHGAAAGLHLMLTFDGTFSDVELAAAVLAEGVKVQPLSWHAQRPYPPGLVLGYAAVNATEIREGVATIGRVIAGRTVSRARRRR
ncbi:MAG TPA: PLP-dependent aminotransferase family protein [Streptosporangiales bacterium]